MAANNKKSSGFTLVEAIIVTVIIGILATLAMPQYFKAKEKALDREAQANLNLISAAEKINHIEAGEYVACADVAAINNDLKLDLAVPSSPAWEYKVSVTAASGTTPSSFTAAARRVSNTSHCWCIKNDIDEPYDESGKYASGGTAPGSCSW